ncbi:MAG TPA: hypothetical protein P5141_10160, partial [Candidatus Hydrogenedentes bacterium]|nr:hypothetical protein [Candidatus Hydrogenedentota bacterium]
MKMGIGRLFSQPKTWNFLRTAAFLALFAVPGVGWAADKSGKGPEVTAEVSDDGVRVSVGGSLFTVYKTGASQKYPYFFPVNGPVSGEPVTTETSEPYPH